VFPKKKAKQETGCEQKLNYVVTFSIKIIFNSNTLVHSSVFSFSKQSSGPTQFLILSREDAVDGFRSLMGPTAPEEAKEINPDR